MKKVAKKLLLYFLVFGLFFSVPGCACNRDGSEETIVVKKKDKGKDKKDDAEKENGTEGGESGENPAGNENGFKRVEDVYPEAEGDGYVKLGEKMEIPSEGELTREQFLYLLITEFGYPQIQGYYPGYQDVQRDRWLVPYLAAAEFNAVLREESSKFFPEAAMERGTAIVWIINALGIQKQTENPYRDLRNDAEKQAVPLAVEKGIVTLRDSWYVHPEQTITAEEAREMLSKAVSLKAGKRELRTDAKNLLTMQEKVKVTTSGEEKNMPVYVGTVNEPKITFAYPDEVLLELSEGEILFVPPCKVFPQGFLGKVEQKLSEGETISFWVSNPELYEVISELDVSMNYHLTDENAVENTDILIFDAPEAGAQADGGTVGGLDEIIENIENATPDELKNPEQEEEPEQTGEEAGETQETENTGEESGEASGTEKTEGEASGEDEKKAEEDPYFAYYAGDRVVDKDGHTLWSAFGGVAAGDTITIATESFEKKEGAYGQVILSLDVAADIIIMGDGLKIDFFDLYTNITSEVELTAGYHLSGEVSGANRIFHSYAIPVAGPISLMISPYLVTDANGDFKVEAYAKLHNDIGMECFNGEFTSWLTPTMELKFEAEAEGKVTIGPELRANLTLLGTPFFDGAALVELTAFAGVRADGKMAVKQEFSVDADGKANYTGHQNTPDEDGNLHTCYLCAQGQAKLVASGSVGIGEEIQKALKKVFGEKLKLTYKTPEWEQRLFDWHFSTGPDFDMEFEPRKCPHLAYPIALRAYDTVEEAPICDVPVKVEDAQKVFTKLVFGSDFKVHEEEGKVVQVPLQDSVTDKNGYSIYYLEYGQYAFSIRADGYMPDEISKAFWAQEKGTHEFVYEFREKRPVLAKSSEMAFYQGQLYAQRTIPNSEFQTISVEGAIYPAKDQMLFYKDKLYFTCKTSGTSEFSTALCVCNPDGSGVQVLIDDPFIDYDHPTEPLSRVGYLFVIDDDKLFYNVDVNTRDIACYDLKTGEKYWVTGAEYPWIAKNMNWGIYSDAIYNSETGFYRKRDEKKKVYQIYQWKETEDVLLYETKDWLQGPFLATEDTLYFAVDRGDTAYLYQLNLDDGEVTLIDSHVTAGSGGYFNY